MFASLLGAYFDREAAFEVDDGVIGGLVVGEIILDDRDALAESRALLHLVLIHFAVPAFGKIIERLFERGGEQGGRMDVFQHRVDERAEHGLFGFRFFDLVYFPELVFQGTILIGIERGI